RFVDFYGVIKTPLDTTSLPSSTASLLHLQSSPAHYFRYLNLFGLLLLMTNNVSS
ncbi:hypothetical protein L9F63_023258, partial [Diploptera punctata]